MQVYDGAFASDSANTAISFATLVNQPSASRDVYVGTEDTLLTRDALTGLLANDLDRLEMAGLREQLAAS